MPRRGKYQGVLQILTYNRGFYLAALAFLAILVAFHAVAFALAAGLWILVSLAVSHYVYDRSSLYSLDWVNVRPAAWLNVHAGLDETSGLLAQRLRPSTHRVFDVFDPAQMTEPSIARARELHLGPNSAPPVAWRDLPAEAAAFDTVFVIFAAHEFRRAEPRTAFFSELARVLKPEGHLIVVEHLRDVPNFLAYGPGCLHFHSRRTWQATFAAAKLVTSREFRVTPFVRVFELTRL